MQKKLKPLAEYNSKVEKLSWINWVQYADTFPSFLPQVSSENNTQTVLDIKDSQLRQEEVTV